MRKLPTLEGLLKILVSPNILTTHKVFIGGECSSVTSIDQSKLRLAIYGAKPKRETVSAQGKSKSQIEGEYPGYAVEMRMQGRFADITEIIEFS